MIALGAFLLRIIPVVASYFMTGFRMWHLGIFAGLSGLVVLFLDKLVLMFAVVAGTLIRAVVMLGVRILLFLVDALPAVPADFGTVAWGTIVGFLGAANRYVPIDVLFQYLGLYVTVYTLVLVWKVIKFARGGG